MADDREIWKNVSRGTALVNVYDHNGAETQKVVRAGKHISMTTDERLYLNTERAMKPGADIFSSGTMVAVKLLDTTRDKEEIEANPNQLSEADLQEMLSLQWKKFDSALEEITNVQALIRLFDMANSDEGTTVRQLESIKARVAEVDPSVILEED